MNNLISIKDVLIIPLLLFIIFFIATTISNKKNNKKPYFKYFTIGLFIKIFGGLALALIYTLHYGESDTHYYYFGSGSIVKMFNKDFGTFIKLLLGNHTDEIRNMFDATTGYPTYFRDHNAFTVCRLNTFFYILSFGSFLANTIIMNFFLFFGFWRFYEMLITFYPNNEKLLAYGMFFIPSVVFWGGGILKDGWTLIAFLSFFVNIWNVFFKKEKVLISSLKLLFWGYVAFSIRPYIFYVTIFTSLIWIGLSLTKKIKGSFLRLVLFPIIFLIFWIGGALIFAKTASNSSGRYQDINSILETAAIIQDDLKKDYYGGNSFDIGTFEPTITGVLKKLPQALTAGLFRPFIWESKNPLMLTSGLENFIILTLFIWLIIKKRLLIFKYLQKDSFLLSLFIASLTFGFFIGLTTANFGALVRYNIICKLPFTICLIQMANYNIKETM